MAKTIQIERLVRIVSLLTANKKGLSSQKISEKLKEAGIIFSDRTIRRDFNDIENAFGIEIIFDKKEKIWRIDPETLSDQQHLLDHLLLMEAYRRAKDQHILLVEPQPERGLEMLNPILTAITQNLLISFHYKAFYSEETTEREALAYAVKEYQGRWYLIATDDKQSFKLKAFAFDRMSNLKVLEVEVERPKLDMETFFNYFYGISMAENDPRQQILLSFNYEQGQYVKTLKLHPSQVVVFEDDKEVRVQLTLAFPQGEAPYDLVMRLCSFSDSVKVLAPASLAQQVKARLKAGYKQYN